jgi:hypothetical protein
MHVDAIRARLRSLALLPLAVSLVLTQACNPHSVPTVVALPTAPKTTADANEQRPVSAAPPRAVDEPRLTKLRMTVESSSQWGTIDLRGGSIHVGGQPAVSAGAAQIYSGTGLAVQRGQASAARAVVDVVYALPDASSLELLVCKNTDGVVDVRIERVTGSTPVSVARLVAGRADGVWEGGCANKVRAPVATAGLVPAGTWPQPVVNARSTFAVYSPWYDDAMFQQQPFVDRPRGPYDTTDPAAVRAMVDQAWGAGIDGFVYWHNGHAESFTRMDLVVAAAEAHGTFTFAPQLDISQLPSRCGFHDAATVRQWASDLLAHAGSTAQLKVGGRPVLFVWGTDCLPASTWSAVRSGLRQQGLDPFVVGDSPDAAYDFDGFWLLNPNTVPDSDRLSSWYRWWGDQARLTPQRSLGSDPVLWAAGISPGEQDDHSGKHPSMWLQVPRANGERYHRVWQAAAASRPEWMVISSWNDFHEATYVQPSEGLGSLALDQTAAWTSWFRGR